MNDRRPVGLERPRERVRGVLRLDAPHRHAVRSADGGEVGLDELDGERLAIRPLLILAKDPVGAVVDEQELRGETVLARARELGDSVPEAAVSDNGERRGVR